MQVRLSLAWQLLFGLCQIIALHSIVSNKIQEGVTPLNKEYFGDRLPVAIGERPGLQRKPAPDMVLQALKDLNSTPEESIYVGDSEVDVATAENSGLLCIWHEKRFTF